jgi:outer membrane protein assembly factor BamB
MTNASRMTRRSATLLLPSLALALGGCSWFDWLTDEAAKPIPGNREPVLSPVRGLQVDAVEGVTLPPVETNPDWTQPHRNLAHVGGNLAGGLTKAWTADIGAGGDYRTRLTAEPIVVGGRVFTMDSDGAVAAWDAGSGKQFWSQTTKPKHNRGSNIGGGIAFAGGRIYAATGRAELVVLDAGSGDIVFRKPLPSPARSAPTIVDNALYLCTIDQKLVALNISSGAQLWVYQATKADAGILASASPAFSSGLIVAGFESGDLAAVRADTGSLAWSDNLGSLKGSTSLLEFATVRGAPVIDDNIVYAIGFGGLMAALDLRTGRRVWERDIAGGNTPWLAGDTLFVITADQRAAAVAKEDGSVHWVTNLPRFTNPKKTKGFITWAGPVLIGGKLVAVSSDAHMSVMDPVDGKIVSTTELDEAVSLAPIVAQGTVFILDDDATLTAYK